MAFPCFKELPIYVTNFFRVLNGFLTVFDLVTYSFKPLQYCKSMLHFLCGAPYMHSVNFPEFLSDQPKTL